MGRKFRGSVRNKYIKRSLHITCFILATHYVDKVKSFTSAKYIFLQLESILMMNYLMFHSDGEIIWAWNRKKVKKSVCMYKNKKIELQNFLHLAILKMTVKLHTIYRFGCLMPGRIQYLVGWGQHFAIIARITLVAPDQELTNLFPK